MCECDLCCLGVTRLVWVVLCLVGLLVCCLVFVVMGLSYEVVTEEDCT